MKYEELFRPFKLGTLELKNRIVFPACATHFQNKGGYVSDKTVRWYEDIAMGGVGMIIVESNAIHKLPSANMFRLNDDSYIQGLKRVIDTIHKYGVPCGVQLFHWLKVSRKYRDEPTTIEVNEIHTVVDHFVSAAKRAYLAGADFIQIHAAHSSSFASFLSPLANQRKDEYGGNIKNRAKVLLDTISSIKKECGDEVLISCRINGDDFIAGGLTNHHACETAKLLEEAGIFYLDVSAGGRYEDGKAYTGYSGQRLAPPRDYPEGCNIHLMEAVRKSVHIPVQGGGKVSMPEVAERILWENRIDLIAICRPIIADPQWPSKAREGRENDIRRCTYCCHCLDTVRHFMPLSCPVWKDGRGGDKMFSFKPISKEIRIESSVLYDKYRYAGNGSIYVPRVEHFPADSSN